MADTVDAVAPATGLTGCVADTARCAQAWHAEAAARWPAAMACMTPPGARAPSGLRMIATLRCAVVARALTRGASARGEAPSRAEDARMATRLAEALNAGMIGNTLLRQVSNAATHDGSGARLVWPGRGAIWLGRMLEASPVARSVSGEGHGVTRVGLCLEHAAPQGPTALSASARDRPYLVMRAVVPAEEPGQVRVCFEERSLRAEEWDAWELSGARDVQQVLDGRAAAEVCNQMRTADGVEADAAAWQQTIRRFTRRPPRDCWLVPRLGAHLRDLWGCAHSPDGDGDPARAERDPLDDVIAALDSLEACLVRAWESPRPVVDAQLPEPGAPRPFALACFGDNLDVMRTLAPGLGGDVDGVYIDPPYDTGTRDFRYPDRYGAAAWLSMMRPRVDLLRSLMAPHGAMHISINEARLFELKLSCDAIFGEGEYLGTTTVRVRHDDRILKGHKAIHEVTDFLVGYRRDATHVPGVRPPAERPSEYVWRLECHAPPEASHTLGGKRVDRYAPGAFTLEKVPAGSVSGLLKRINIRGALRESNSSGRFFVRHLGDALRETPGCLFRVHGMGGDGLGYRDFVMPAATSGRKNPDYLQGPPVTARDRGGRPYPNLVDFSRAFNQVHKEGGVAFRNGKKPLAFLRHVFALQGLEARPHARVIDCFGGSGATACALAELDASDGGERCGVLVENGPWYDDVLLPRLQAARAEGGPAAERPLASLRLAGFADVLDHLALVDADDGADGDPRHLEHRPLLSLHVESNGRCEWSLSGANEPLRTLEVRAVSGLTTERVTVQRGLTVALALGLDPTVRPPQPEASLDTNSRHENGLVWRLGDAHGQDVVLYRPAEDASGEVAVDAGVPFHRLMIGLDATAT